MCDAAETSSHLAAGIGLIDISGIMLEFFQNAGEEFPELMAEMFTNMVGTSGEIPMSWKTATIKVLFKAGIPEDPKCYRPISIISIMYKDFSTLLLNRMEEQLEASQTCDQAQILCPQVCRTW